MTDSQGIVQTNQSAIASIFVDYYKDLLGKVSGKIKAFKNFMRNGKCLSIEQQIQFLKPYTRAEVKDAMFHIDVYKNPGLDGFGSGFFKASWSMVGEDVTNAILEFFDNSQMLKQLNSTIIILIFKVEDPLNASQSRAVMPCVSASQNSFVPD